MATNFVCLEPGELWFTWMTTVMNNAHSVFDGSETLAVVFTQFEGYRALELQKNIEGIPDPIIERMVLFSMGATQVCPPRYFVNSRNFNTVAPTIDFNPQDADPFLSFMEGYVIEYILDVKIQLMETWAGAEPSNGQMRRVDMVPDAMAQYVTSAIIEKDGDAVVITDRCIAFTTAFIPPADQYRIPTGGFQSPQPTPTTLTDTSRISQALEDLASQDLDITLNNGRAIFSVRSKVITGS